VAARVIAQDTDSLVLADHEGTLEASWANAENLVVGSWIVAVGAMEMGVLRCTAVSIETLPLATYPRAGGDVRWFQDDKRRRLNALVQRSAILREIRSYFNNMDFIEVETPQMVPSPGLDVHLEAFEIGNRKRLSPERETSKFFPERETSKLFPERETSKLFPERETSKLFPERETSQFFPERETSKFYLHTSPEYQMKRLLVAGLPRVMQICRASRRGEQGQRHEPEFTMLEWYRAFAGSDDVMRDSECMVAQVAQAVLGQTRVVGAGGNEIDLAAPWDRMTVHQAFTQLAGVEVDDVLPDEENFFLILTETIEPKLGRNKPVFLTEWPASMASLARTFPDRPQLADRFEAFVDGMELCNGFGELVDPVEQRRRFVRDQEKRAEMGLAVYPLDERFLSALEEGMPPSGGNALGVDRLVMLLTGAKHIEDCVAFGAERL